MKSATSCCEVRGWFSPALLWKNITRFSPIWILYTLIQFLLLPAPIFADLLSREPGRSESFLWLVYSAVERAPVVGLIYGAVMAMALFSYLMNRRSAQLYHVLPIRREGLFLTNWVSGLLFNVVPTLTVGLLTALAGALGGYQLPHLAVAVVYQLAANLFFFSLAVFCGSVTGNLLAMPVFYGIVNMLAYGIQTLVGLALEELCVGFRLYFGGQLVRLLTPLNTLLELVYTRQDNSYPVGDFLLYTLLGTLLFALLTLLIYRSRQLERAGDLVTVGWLRPVFQWGTGLCLGLLLGYLLYEIIFRDRFSVGVFIVLSALFAVLAAIGARMLLTKTLRVFREGWKGFAAIGLVMLLSLTGIRLDLPGRQRYVPQADEVQEVRFEVGGHVHYFMTITDPEQIQALTEVHRSMVKRLDLADGNRYGMAIPDYDGKEEIYLTPYVEFHYEMKNGMLVDRAYQYLVRAEDLTDPASGASKLEAFLNRPDIALMRHVQSQVGDLTMDQLTAVEGYYSTELDNSDGYLDAAEAKQVLEAFRTDLAAGRIRVSLLWDADAQQNELFDMDLYVMGPMVDRNGDGKPDERLSGNLRVPVQRSATALLEALDQIKG